MKLITIIQYAMWKAEDMARINNERLKAFETVSDEELEDYLEIEKTFYDCMREYTYLRKCLHRMSKENEVQKTLEDVLEW